MPLLLPMTKVRTAPVLHPSYLSLDVYQADTEGTSPFAFAVSTMEKTAILALTPSVVSLKSQALRPKTTGRMLFSALYPDI